MLSHAILPIYWCIDVSFAQVLARRPTSLSLQFPHPEAGLLHYAPVQVCTCNDYDYNLGYSHGLDEP